MTVSPTAPGRPVVRYPGGKWLLAPWILEHLPPHEVYCEPFGGAASVLMLKERSRAEIYNDLDEELGNLFRTLRDPETNARLRELIALTPFSRREFDLAYEPAPDPVEQARRTITRFYLAYGSTGSAARTRTGFRSRSYLSNGSDARAWGRLPDAFPAWLDRLRGVVLECLPALDVIQDHDGESTLHYLDPPYPLCARTAIRCPAERSRFYRHEMFRDEDHRELASVVRSLRGMVALSGYPCALYDELYPDWLRVTRESRVTGGASRTEALWLNAAAVAALHHEPQQPSLPWGGRLKGAHDARHSERTRQPDAPPAAAASHLREQRAAPAGARIHPRRPGDAARPEAGLAGDSDRTEAAGGRRQRGGGMRPQIGVSVSFWCHDGQGRFLMHRRGWSARDEHGCWDFGAGALEFGEELAAGVLRELGEEYGCGGEIEAQLPAHSILRRNLYEIPTHWVVIPFIIRIDPAAATIGEPETMTEMGWFRLSELPEPLHTGVRQTLEKIGEHFEPYGYARQKGAKP